MLDWDQAVGPEGLLHEVIELSARAPAPLLNLWMPAYDRLAAAGRERGCVSILTGGGGDEWLIVSPYYAADLIRGLDLAGLVTHVQRSSALAQRLGAPVPATCRLALRPQAVGGRLLCRDPRRRAPSLSLRGRRSGGSSTRSLRGSLPTQRSARRWPSASCAAENEQWAGGSTGRRPHVPAHVLRRSTVGLRAPARVDGARGALRAGAPPGPAHAPTLLGRATRRVPLPDAAEAAQRRRPVEGARSARRSATVSGARVREPAEDRSHGVREVADRSRGHARMVGARRMPALSSAGLVDAAALRKLVDETLGNRDAPEVLSGLGPASFGELL